MKVAVYNFTKKRGGTLIEEFENRQFLTKGKGKLKGQYKQERN